MLIIGDCRIQLEGVLAGLDALTEAAPEEVSEDFEDLNAELEDELLSLSGIRTDAEDWRDEARDALEDLWALAGDYRALADVIAGLDALADKLESICDQALAEL